MLRSRVVQVHTGTGGIPKRPVLVLEVTEAGAKGDRFRQRKIHGGPDQRILLIAIEDLTWLKQQGFVVEAGSLGENITTEGLDFREIAFGDRLLIGQVLLEVTKLRKPCKTLDSLQSAIGPIQPLLHDKRHKMGENLWGRGGFYAKVLKPGTIQADDTIELVRPSSSD